MNEMMFFRLAGRFRKLVILRDEEKDNDYHKGNIFLKLLWYCFRNTKQSLAAFYCR